MKERIARVDSCSAKDNIKRIKDKPQTGRKYFQKTHLIDYCYPKYTKNFCNSIVGRGYLNLIRPKILTDISPRRHTD